MHLSPIDLGLASASQGVRKLLNQLRSVQRCRSHKVLLQLTATALQKQRDFPLHTIFPVEAQSIVLLALSKILTKYYFFLIWPTAMFIINLLLGLFFSLTVINLAL